MVIVYLFILIVCTIGYLSISNGYNVITGNTQENIPLFDKEKILNKTGFDPTQNSEG